jgi:hypothetical protein
MDMKTQFVILVTTGEYEDAQTWAVGIAKTKKKAEAAVKRAKEEAQKNIEKASAFKEKHDYMKDVPKYRSYLLKNFDWQSVHVITFYVEEVEII